MRGLSGKLNALRAYSRGSRNEKPETPVVNGRRRDVATAWPNDQHGASFCPAGPNR